jgi:hypothetical protein
MGLDYLTHLHMSKGFDSVLIVVDHLTRMAHFMPCRDSVSAEKTATLFYTDCLAYLSMIATRDSSVASGTHFGNALERV